MSKMMNRCSSSKRRKTTSTSSYDDDDHGASSSFDHEDLIWEFLFRLPPKHVLQFKCVSKRWHSIISNPVFLRNHSLRYHRRSCPQPLHHNDDFLLLPHDGVQDVLLLSNLLDHDSHPDQPLADISVLPIAGVLPVAKGSEFGFVDSCNGLLLYADSYNTKKRRAGFRCISRVVLMDDDEDLYYLFNPVTKDYIKLPDLMPAIMFNEDDDKRVRYTNFDTRILFDPSVSLSYKVIRFVYRSARGGYPHPETVNQSQIYIYSSSESSADSSWRLSTSMAGFQKFATTSGVFLNGVMYWVTAGTDLLCFDAEKNSVWFQPLPPNPKPELKEHHVFYFGKCGGRLCLVGKYGKYMGRSNLNLYDGFDIMEMTTEDARWTKKYQVNLGVNLSHLIDEKIQILHIYKTRTNQFKEEEEEEEALLMKLEERIVSFSFKSNTFFGKELTTPNSRHPFGYADVYPTSMTLFPL